MRTRPMKARVINWGYLGPLLAHLALAGVLVGGAVYLAHHGHRTAMPSPHIVARSQDELLRELAYCQTLGAKSANDMDCIAAWAENRRRFFEAGVAPSNQGVFHP